MLVLFKVQNQKSRLGVIPVIAFCHSVHTSHTVSFRLAIDLLHHQAFPHVQQSRFLIIRYFHLEFAAGNGHVYIFVQVGKIRLIHNRPPGNNLPGLMVLPLDAPVTQLNFAAHGYFIVRIALCNQPMAFTKQHNFSNLKVVARHGAYNLLVCHRAANNHHVVGYPLNLYLFIGRGVRPHSQRVPFALFNHPVTPRTSVSAKHSSICLIVHTLPPHSVKLEISPLRKEYRLISFICCRSVVVSRVVIFSNRLAGENNVKSFVLNPFCNASVL